MLNLYFTEQGINLKWCKYLNVKKIPTEILQRKKINKNGGVNFYKHVWKGQSGECFLRDSESGSHKRKKNAETLLMQITEWGI